MFVRLVAKFLHIIPLIFLIVLLVVGLLFWMKYDNSSLKNDIANKQEDSIQNKMVVGLKGEVLHFRLKKRLVNNKNVFYDIFSQRAFSRSKDINLVYMNTVYMIKHAEDEVSYLWSDYGIYNKTKKRIDLNSHVLYKVVGSDYYSKVAHYNINTDIITGDNLLMVKDNGDKMLSKKFHYDSKSKALHVQGNVRGIFFNNQKEEDSKKGKS